MASCQPEAYEEFKRRCQPFLNGWLGFKSKTVTDTDLVFVSLYLSDKPFITKLNLIDQYLTSVETISAWWNIKELYLSRNQLTNFGDLFLPDLVELHLDGNQLTKIPRFCHLISLSVLDLGDNLLREVPDLSHLRNLTSLNLRKNMMTVFPLFGLKNPNLTIYLENQKVNCESLHLDEALHIEEKVVTIEKIDETIKLSERYHRLIKDIKLEKKFLANDNESLILSDYDLGDEDLVFIDHFVKTKGWKIKELCLCENNLTEFPVLRSFPDLETFCLSYNDISKLGDISSTPKLKTLWLADNLLTGKIDLSGWCLKKIDLSRNKITEIIGDEEIEEVRSDLPKSLIREPMVGTVIDIVKTLLSSFIDKEQVKKALFDDSETGQRAFESCQKLREFFDQK